MANVKEATLDAKKEQVDLLANQSEEVELSNGKKVRIGWLLGVTQDKIDKLIVDYECYKKSLKKVTVVDSKEEVTYEETDIARGNKKTRQFYTKAVAAILINNYIGLKLYWWLKWRLLYYFSKWNGQDFINVIAIAKKKAMEGEYRLAMVFLMDMTTTWTTMTKTEAEEYRHELELVKEAQSLKNSQASENH